STPPSHAAISTLSLHDALPISLGIIMTLILGVGMCLSMGVLGNGGPGAMIVGIAVGVIGFVGMGVNYPVYRKLLESGKRKYAFRSEEHTSELQSRFDLVCRLLL